MYYPVFISAANSSQIPKVDTSTNYLSYTPSTGTLTCQVLNAASDIKIKQDIYQLSTEYANALLTKLNPVEYRFKNDPTKRRFGFIAQEVEQQFNGENLGLYHKQNSEDGTEKHYISYLELISPIIKVVNSLVETVASLKTENIELKNKLDDIIKLL